MRKGRFERRVRKGAEVRRDRYSVSPVMYQLSCEFHFSICFIEIYSLRQESKDIRFTEPLWLDLKVLIFYSPLLLPTVHSLH